MSNFTLGADPEVFLWNGKKIVSAIGKIGGTKKNPKPIKELGKGFAVQEDNVLLEYNIPAANDMDNFYNNMKVINDYIKELAGELGLEISVQASASLSKEELMDPRAHVFGCDPDFNVWTLEPNPRPSCDDPSFRCAGGHLHIGINLPKSQLIMLARWLDVFIGLPMAFYDPDKERSKLYGAPGSIRFKPYGIEYRTPSNFWTSKSQIWLWIWDQINKAINSTKTKTKFIVDPNNFITSFHKPVFQKEMLSYLGIKLYV